MANQQHALTDSTQSSIYHRLEDRDSNPEQKTHIPLQASIYLGRFIPACGDSDYPTWRMWLDAAGYEHEKTEHGLRISNSAAVLQAAIDGQGLALARSVMVKDDLQAGVVHLGWPDS